MAGKPSSVMRPAAGVVRETCRNPTWADLIHTQLQLSADLTLQASETGSLQATDRPTQSV